MLLSIISPVYNVKTYLKRFVISLVEQNVEDYELILIDDGSNDGSGELCNKLSETYANIEVIHKENGGVSSARNEGVKVAKGEYIFFVDSDDIFAKNILFKVMEFIKQNKNVETFIVPVNLLRNMNLEIRSYNKYVEYSSYIKLCDQMVIDNLMLPWNICSMIYKAEYFKSNNFKFNSRYTSAEDLDLFLQVVKSKPNIKVFPNGIINYRLGRTGSADNTISYQNIISQLEVYKKAYRIFSSDDLLSIYFANRFTNIVVQIESINMVSQKNICYEFIRENYNIITKSHGFKYLAAKLIWKCFGLKFGTKIIQKLRTIKDS